MKSMSPLVKTYGEPAGTKTHYQIFGEHITDQTLDEAIENMEDTHEMLTFHPLPKTEGIGDINSDDKGTGARYNSGKPKLSLIPLTTLYDEARVWEYGEKKYKAWNWTKGMQWSVPLECALRHLARWQAGEENDEESGLPHLAHAMCNLRMLTLYAKTYTEGDDRPPAGNLP